MFTTIATVLGVLSLYYLFVENGLVSFFSSRKAKKRAMTSAEKVARVKATSDDPKEIETFITKNAENLGEESLNKLIERIELLKADRIINDDILKRRISEEVELAEEPLLFEEKKRTRKK